VSAYLSRAAYAAAEDVTTATSSIGVVTLAIDNISLSLETSMQSQGIKLAAYVATVYV